MFEALQPRPNDAIMELMQQCKADTRPQKIDLGVGVYKDAAGQTVIMESVKMAEQMWGREETTKSCLLYTSPSPRDGLLSRMPSSA